eukprot:GILI01011006.1.p1 GENE.GILI01011006.1~~GILI01011006.1.p1  ORF type:complete len:156 (-),score=20.99 GILI01011006.1:81-548(-)
MMENFQNFQTAHLNGCMVRFGHLLPIFAVVACTAVSCIVLFQQQIVFELNLVPQFHPFTTVANTTTAVITAHTELTTIPSSGINVTTMASTTTSTTTTTTVTTEPSTTPTETIQVTTTTTKEAPIRHLDIQDETDASPRQRDVFVAPPPIRKGRA